MSLFRFKQFSVSHDFGMKIGTDAVLLGVWVSIQAVKNALDVGTGTGIIALMLAQRGINNVVGIDIDPKSVEEARFNVQQSPWKHSVSMSECDFCDDHQVLSLGRFDLIVSNPPFFIDSMKSPFNQRNKARHSDSLPFETLIKNAIRLLNDHGKFCLILPAREAEIFTTLAARQQLFPEKICDIFPYPDSPFNRKMISFQRQQVSPHHESLCIRNHDRSYSNEYLMLTKDFYLNLEEQQQKQ